jgi:protein-L-isoaspartate(D-aspartate) O-methyltransferase
MMTLEECRRFYADEVRFSANVQTPGLVEAFARVPREKFLGPGPWEIGSAEVRSLAALGAMQMVYTTVSDARDVYHNVVIALDKATDTNNGQPGSLARWIDALALKEGERVYHLGSGVGYYTAVMAETVGAGGVVVTSEVQPELAERAKQNLASYANVTVHAGDGTFFDPGACDAILINAGVTHPHAMWLDRLREGGRMVLPLTMAVSATLGVGIMVKVVRENGGFSAQMVTSVAIYSCTSGRDPQLEPMMRQAIAGGLNQMKSVRRDAHEKGDTCLLHGTNVCVSGAEVSAPAARVVVH